MVIQGLECRSKGDLVVLDRKYRVMRHSFLGLVLSPTSQK